MITEWYCGTGVWDYTIGKTADTYIIMLSHKRMAVISVTDTGIHICATDRKVRNCMIRPSHRNLSMFLISKGGVK